MVNDWARGNTKKRRRRQKKKTTWRNPILVCLKPRSALVDADADADTAVVDEEVSFVPQVESEQSMIRCRCSC